MNCFWHVERPAVGICGHCLRGLCTECAAEVGAMLACRGRCEDDVARCSALRQWSLQQRRLYTQRIAWYTAAGWLLTVFGFAFGLAAYTFRYAPDVMLGAAVSMAGIIMLVSTYWRRPERTSTVRECVKCGYNLTGNTSGRCPECGWATAMERKPK